MKVWRLILAATALATLSACSPHLTPGDSMTLLTWSSTPAQYGFAHFSVEASDAVVRIQPIADFDRSKITTVVCVALTSVKAIKYYGPEVSDLSTAARDPIDMADCAKHRSSPAAP